MNSSTAIDNGLGRAGAQPVGELTLIEAVSVTKSFPASTAGSDDLRVVEDFSLRVREGELVTIFGPNGCGKSTILNLFAGTLAPDTGSVRCNGDGTGNMAVGYVFQNHADTLLPWRTVRSNIAFPLELRGAPKADAMRRVDARIEQFHLREHASKYIYELSGGLKQLVAIARATVYDPRLLLLDEPFSALDFSVSRSLWLSFRQFWADQNVATVFVSHNVDEAIFLGDRICILSCRPARVVADIQINLGRQRELCVLISPEFLAVRTAVLEAFERGRRT